MRISGTVRPGVLTLTSVHPSYLIAQLGHHPESIENQGLLDCSGGSKVRGPFAVSLGSVSKNEERNKRAIGSLSIDAPFE